MARPSIRNADIAMYQAKRSGKGRRLCLSRGCVRRDDRHGMKADLELALERGQLRVDYQPIVSLADRRVAGAEAFVRWQRQYGKLLTAAEFIPMAQETGSIVAFGEFVLPTRAGRPGLAGRGLSPRRGVQSNLSAAELDDPLLVSRVSEALEHSRLLPRHS